ncbi:hypothetical protein [Aurantiacibacter odishensis]|uniref:hypothetical protein n=1 Tax=Aurantiacibacter odishensis TaxID=1155476 RepID=UPI000E76E53E|nr:hypothetical protein [Aurantiacibacter odishensis]
MNQQTGNDRYAGTTPPRENQEPQMAPEGDAMQQQKQAGAQMENQTHRGDREQRRQQAEQQSDKGLGYGAQDGEEMADAPDVTERGYGGASEEREEKLDKKD